MLRLESETAKSHEQKRQAIRETLRTAENIRCPAFLCEGRNSENERGFPCRQGRIHHFN